MSKRIVRISGRDISTSVNEIMHRKVNVVLENGQTYFGNIKSSDNSKLVFADTRDHIHHFSIPDIFEILYDQSSLN